MRIPAFLATVLLFAGTFPAAAQQDVTDLCNRATMTAAALGTITPEAISFGGTERYFCTYTPSGFAGGTQYPLLVALHGGDGNASQMMADNHGIIAAAEAMGYIAVFPNGLPRDRCTASLCLDNNWGDPDNVFFVAELISRQKATGQVADDRVHLVGFSGGAGLIYTIAATPGFPHAINSVATVAGAFGLYHDERPDNGFFTIQLQEGTPVSALLAQGGLDPKLPAAGGLDATGHESHVSFRTKVDFWRLATGTAGAIPQPVDVLALDPGAPVDLEAVRYNQGGRTVVELLDPNLGHEWPSWDIMAVAVELFERN